jgi:hypothetical protein
LRYCRGDFNSTEAGAARVSRANLLAMQPTRLPLQSKPDSSEIVRARLVLKFAVCAALIAITWAVFGQTLGHEFVNFDDPNYVTENEQVQAGLNWHGVAWALPIFILTIGIR